MMRIFNSKIKIAAGFLLMVLLFSACDGVLQNPMKDKDTGEDINLLIVDFNFFKTHITVNLFDATTRERIVAPATVSFSGKNGNDIVTYSGNKRVSHEILNGELKLTVDPNVQVTEPSPLAFAITAEAEGYSKMSKTETFLSDGIKSVDLYLAKVTDGTDIGGDVVIDDGDTTIVFGFASSLKLKSTTIEKPFKIKYALTINDFLKLSDTNGNLLFASSQEFLDAYNADKENFLSIKTSTFNDYPWWPEALKADGILKNVMFHILETGTIETMTVGGKLVGNFNGAQMKADCSWVVAGEPALWGFVEFADGSWLFKNKQLAISALPYNYTLMETSGEAFCSTGATIRFEAGFKSSFTLVADVVDLQGKQLFTQTFTGNFPTSFVLENVPAVPAKLVFRNTNPSFKPLADLDMPALCSGNHTVTVQPQDGFSGYQIVLKAFCDKNPLIAVAPTYSGEYRFAGSNGTWQGGFMQGGVLDLLGKPDQEYEYRLLWENEWEVTHFTTTFNADGSYPFESDSKVSSEKLPDGRTRINMIHTFKQSVCDTMNW